MSRQIWQTVEVEVDLEKIGMDEEPERDSDVLEHISWFIDGDPYEYVKGLVDEQISEGEDEVNEQRDDHSLGEWKVEIKK